MAATFTLISSQTISSAQSTVTFSSIPQTYTDLYVVISAKTNRSNVDGEPIFVRPNNVSTNIDSTRLFETSNNVSAYGQSNYNWYCGIAGTTSQDSDSWGASYAYFIGYTSTTDYKVGYSEGGTTGGTSSGSFIEINGQVWRNTDAITSLVFYPETTSNQFQAQSTFSLYGIKNA
jgi:hypothetical protein